jgi:hypothetical protein
MAYIGKQPVVGNFVKLDAITTSATATYNLLNGGVAYFPQTANNCIVSLNGVIQSPTSAYTISGSTIVFSDALTASDSIDFILVLGDVLNIGTPSDNTVSLAKLTATGTKDSTTFLRGDNTFQTIGANTPAFLAVRTTNQSIAGSNTLTTITYSSEVYDTNSAFDIATGIFTAPSAGKYFFSAGVRSASAFAGVEDGEIFLEGSTSNNTTSLRLVQANTRLVGTVSIFMNMSINDTMKVTFQHNTVGAKNVESARFGGFKLI